MHMKSFAVIQDSKSALVEMEDKGGSHKFHPLLTPELQAAINIFCNDEYKRWKDGV